MHSTIYYALDDNIISDATWSRWAQELEDLQNKYPDVADRCPLAEEFRGFEHSTGSNLPFHNSWAFGTAMWLLALRDRNNVETDT